MGYALPNLEITGVTSVSHDASASLLWRRMQLGPLSRFLTGVPTEHETKFANGQGFAVKRACLSKLEAFTLDLGVGSYADAPTEILVSVRNSGDSEIEINIITPRDLELQDIPMWARDLNISSALSLTDDAHFSFVQSSNIISVWPPVLTLPPGEESYLRLVLRHTHVGRHALPVVLQVKDGRVGVLYLKGTTLTPQRPFLSVRSSVIAMPDTMLGLPGGMESRVELRNEGSSMAYFRVNVLGAVEHDVEVFQVFPRTGVLHPNELCYLQVLFNPLKVEQHRAVVQVEVLKIDDHEAVCCPAEMEDPITGVRVTWPLPEEEERLLGAGMESEDLFQLLQVDVVGRGYVFDPKKTFEHQHEYHRSTQKQLKAGFDSLAEHYTFMGAPDHQYSATDSTDTFDNSNNNNNNSNSNSNIENMYALSHMTSNRSHNDQYHHVDKATILKNNNNTSRKNDAAKRRGSNMSFMTEDLTPLQWGSVPHKAHYESLTGTIKQHVAGDIVDPIGNFQYGDLATFSDNDLQQVQNNSTDFDGREDALPLRSVRMSHGHAESCEEKINEVVLKGIVGAAPCQSSRVFPGMYASLSTEVLCFKDVPLMGVSEAVVLIENRSHRVKKSMVNNNKHASVPMPNDSFAAQRHLMKTTNNKTSNDSQPTLKKKTKVLVPLQTPSNMPAEQMMVEDGDEEDWTNEYARALSFEWVDEQLFTNRVHGDNLLSIEPQIGTLQPGEVQLVRFVFKGSQASLSIEGDLRCVIRWDNESFARAEKERLQQELDRQLLHHGMEEEEIILQTDAYGNRLENVKRLVPIEPPSHPLNEKQNKFSRRRSNAVHNQNTNGQMVGFFPRGNPLPCAGAPLKFVPKPSALPLVPKDGSLFLRMKVTVTACQADPETSHPEMTKNDPFNPLNGLLPATTVEEAHGRLSCPTNGVATFRGVSCSIEEAVARLEAATMAIPTAAASNLNNNNSNVNRNNNLNGTQSNGNAKMHAVGNTSKQQQQQQQQQKLNGGVNSSAFCDDDDEGGNDDAHSMMSSVDDITAPEVFIFNNAQVYNRNKNINKVPSELLSDILSDVLRNVLVDKKTDRLVDLQLNAPPPPTTMALDSAPASLPQPLHDLFAAIAKDYSQTNTMDTPQTNSHNNQSHAYTNNNLQPQVVSPQTSAMSVHGRDALINNNNNNNNNNNKNNNNDVDHSVHKGKVQSLHAAFHSLVPSNQPRQSSQHRLIQHFDQINNNRSEHQQQHQQSLQHSYAIGKTSSPSNNNNHFQHHNVKMSDLSVDLRSLGSFVNEMMRDALATAVEDLVLNNCNDNAKEACLIEQNHTPGSDFLTALLTTYQQQNPTKNDSK